MNNLLRTLSETRVKAQFPEHDLKTLLSTVKEYRRQSQDTKSTDAFYDSLENMLHDLRTVTPDNHDAEAFLKPVLRAEVPDYYDVISNPMDLQTMLKKVKQRQYKSKREFKDDLDLIWANCFAYNSSENHPLRLCATRLKAKADKLLKHITDKKARVDPDIPNDLANPGATSNTYHRLSIKVNGHINGHSKSGTPTIKVPGSNVGIARKLPPKSRLHSRSPSTLTHTGPLPFSETPALVRTQAGMSAFVEIDSALDPYFNSPSTSSDASTLVAKLKDLLPSSSNDVEEEEPETDFIKEEHDESVGIAAIGNKRKLNGVDHGRPRKRIRYTPNSTFRQPIPLEEEPVTNFWWGAVQSTFLASSSLPHIPFRKSSSPTPETPAPADQKPTLVKRKRRRKDPYQPGYSSTLSTLVANAESLHPRNYKNPTRSLLGIMNNNVRTMKRVQHTHARFTALGLTNKDAGEDGETASKTEIEPPRLRLEQIEEDVGLMNDRIDERPWITRLAQRANDDDDAGGLEIGEKNADDCLHWMGSKVLEHAGFQGTSKHALDVIAGLTSEYLMNVGRLIRYLSDKHAHSMSPEEIILHTLFESGIPKIQDLERYIKDDVERYGSRLGDLEKKLVGAYRDAVSRLAGGGDSTTAVDEDEEEGLFEAEEEEETGALARGDFADTLGVDFFGFREMGLAEEFGLSSLSIPASLLGGKKKRFKPSAIVKPAEPPPPFPPPPPFVPLSSYQIDAQIGLLKSFYTAKAQSSAPPPPPPPLPAPPSAPRLPPLPGPTIPGISNGAGSARAPTPEDGKPPADAPPQGVPTPSIPTIDISIPDDPPTLAQMKMGPLGQILKPSLSSSPAKKKIKAASTPSGGSGGHKPEGSSGPAEGSAPAKKKTKTIMPGVGTGNGRKARKALEAAEAQARTTTQAPGQPAQQTSPGKQSHPPTPAPVPFPPVVVASA